MPSQTTPWRAPSRPLVIGLAVVLLLAGCWAYWYWHRPLPPTPGPPGLTTETVRAWLATHPKAPYRARRSLSLAGARIVQIDHRQHRQGFLVVSGAPDALAAQLFDPGLSAHTLETVANGLLALKQPRQPDRLVLETFSSKALPLAAVPAQGVAQARRFDLRFHTAQRPASRRAQILVARLPSATDGSNTGKTLVATYSFGTAFEPSLLSRFLQDVRAVPQRP